MSLFYPSKRQVILNTKSGKAFRGILWKLHPRMIIVKNAEFLKLKGETVPLDGDLVILREEVEFLQVLG